MKKYKVGEKLTLITRGIRRSDYSNQTWIDQRLKGRASFFEVSRVGRKYLYGFYFYNDIEGLTKSVNEAKINTEDVVIHKGFDTSAILNYKEYLQSLDNYEKTRKQGMYDIDAEIYTIKRALIEKWEANNPRPKPLTIE